MRRVNDLSIEVMAAPILAYGVKSHPGAVFFELLYRNRILAAPAVVPPGLRYGSLQKPTCGVARNVCGCVSTTSDLLRRQTMQKGTVKWFNPTKGYGFIKPAGSDKDVFVHISAVERAGLSTLNEGQAVEYELVTGRNGKASAENLKVA
jgi:CspA family cold shock protein